MQPLVLHPPSLTNSLGQPRFNSGPERLPLNRPWVPNARGCSPRAPLSRQSMSGSPTEERLVTGESRPLGYPPASSPTVTRKTEATIAAASGPSQPPPAVHDPVPAPLPSRYGEQALPVYAASPRAPSGAPPYALSTLETSMPGTAARSLTQKSTRRTKAHVASACVNCKKKHLGCDPARPCRRCVLAGKAVSVSECFFGGFLFYICYHPRWATMTMGANYSPSHPVWT